MSRDDSVLSSVHADEERFRLVTSFNDIFVVIAAILFLTGLNWVGRSFADWTPAFLSMITAWGLAEVFTRRRRMALPSIFLLLVFVVCTYNFVELLVSGLGVSGRLSASVGALCSAFAAAAHWQRFRVPITIAAGTGALVLLILRLLMLIFGDLILSPLVFFVLGLSVLAFAIWVDSRDTIRKTYYSDIAFWLHLLAAPLLVHSVFSNIVFSDDNVLTVLRVQVLEMVLVFVIYAILTMISLVLDRRGLMVAAMIYVIGMGYMLLQSLSPGINSFALIGLLLGASLLLLSAFWYQARRLVLKGLPSRVLVYLPD